MTNETVRTRPADRTDRRPGPAVPPLLTVAGLRKSFPADHRGTAPALAGIDLAVPAGAFATVLGPSGSGKTTLLRCIAGFEEPDEGMITLSGRSLAGVRPHARGIGVVPQEGALFPHLTVGQNVAFGLTGRSRGRRRDRVEFVLDLVGLPGLAGRRPHELSGGQQQRVALARALAPEPELILLDEPFSALDAKLRVELREEVRDLLRRAGATTILVTHDQAEAMTMADHLVVLRAGRVVSAGSPRRVYTEPVDVDLARFLGEATILAGHAGIRNGETVVTCALGELPVGTWHGATGECRVLVRPEDLAVHAGRARAGDRVIAGTVATQSYFGPHALLRVAIPDAGRTVAARVPGDTPHEVGDVVELTVVRPVTTFPPGTRASR